MMKPEPGAHHLLAPLPEPVAELALEGRALELGRDLREQRFARRDGLGDGDVDHGRDHALDQRGEARGRHERLARRLRLRLREVRAAGDGEGGDEDQGTGEAGHRCLRRGDAMLRLGVARPDNGEMPAARNRGKFHGLAGFSGQACLG